MIIIITIIQNSKATIIISWSNDSIITQIKKDFNQDNLNYFKNIIFFNCVFEYDKGFIDLTIKSLSKFQEKWSLQNVLIFASPLQSIFELWSHLC